MGFTTLSAVLRMLCVAALAIALPLTVAQPYSIDALPGDVFGGGPGGGSGGPAPRVLSVGPSQPGWVVDQSGLAVLELRFDAAVDVPAGAVRVTGVDSGPVTVTGQTFDPSTNTLTVELGDGVAGDLITVVVDYTITANGVALDGESGDPESASFPSGDGRPGGQAVFRYRVLQGDANRDGYVNILDVSLLVSQIGLGAGDPAFDARADLNGDGWVNVLDVSILVGGMGGSLPIPDGSRPAVVSTAPAAGAMLTGDLDEVVVSFSEPVSGPLDLHALYAVDRDDVLYAATGVSLAGDGMSATYTFDPAVSQCGEYEIGISPAIGDPSGELLVPATPFEVSGIVPAQAPILDGLPEATRDATVVISGVAVDADVVEISSEVGVQTVPVVGESFAQEIFLAPDRLNVISVTAITPCGTRSAPRTVEVIRDNEKPNVFIDFPADGAVIQSDMTDVAGRVSDRLTGFLDNDGDGEPDMTVTVNGVEAAVDIGIGTNGTFFLAGVPLETDGPTDIVVEARDGLQNGRVTQITVEREEIPVGSPSMAILSGNGQSGVVHSPLVQPIAVKMVRGDGVTPFAGKVVTFQVSRSDGLLGSSIGDAVADGRRMYQVVTDSQGVARAYWVMGSDAGMGNNRVEVTSRDIAGTVLFCASANPAPPDRILIGSGNNQRAEASSPLPQPLRVWVNDACNGVGGIEVTFTVTRGDGVFNNGLQQITATTEATGHLNMPFTLGATAGLNTIEATFDGNPVLPATFLATGIARDLDMPTTFVGRVLDNASRPLGNARLELFVNNMLAAETYTDVYGEFSFTGVPDGPAHVVADGSTADTLAGETIPFNSFPFVGYDFTMVPNAENRLSQPVLLPQKDPANKFLYFGPQVELTIDGIEGLKFTIEEDTLVTLADGTVINGNNFNTVNLTLDQVHFDDIPMALPDGASYPFAWTLQPKAATFDPPIAVELPNMAGLAPGSIGYILQWDGELDEFVITASGQVSEDGSVIRSDPGAGITVAGWGGACPPYPNQGGFEPDCAGFSGTCCSDIPRALELADEARVLLLGIQENLIVAEINIRAIQDTGVFEDMLSLASNAVPSTLAGCAATVFGELYDGNLDTSDALVVACVSRTLSILISAPQIADLITNQVVPLAEVVGRNLDEAQDRITQLRFKYLEMRTTVGCGLGTPQAESAELENVDLLQQRVTEAREVSRRIIPYHFDMDEVLTDANQLAEAMASVLCADFNIACGHSAGTPGERLGQPPLDDWAAQWGDIGERFDQTHSEMIANQAESEDSSSVATMIRNQAAGYLTNDASSARVGTNVVPLGQFGEFQTPLFPTDGLPRRAVITRPGAHGTDWTVSDFASVQGGGTTVLSGFRSLDELPPLPVSLSVSAAGTVLEPGQESQLQVIGSMSDGSSLELPTLLRDGTAYTSSNPDVASVDGDGLVTAIAEGTTFISVLNQGATAVERIDVSELTVSTTAVGFVLFEDGTAAEGALVTTTFGGPELTGSGGAFSLQIDQVPADALLSVSATFDDMDQSFAGGSDPASIVAGGLTEIGVITIRLRGTGPLFPVATYITGDYSQSVSFGDLDGDGDEDMAVASWLGSGGTGVLLNNGDGTFAAQTRYAAGGASWSVSLGDLDGDGDLDMVVANAGSNDASVLLNYGNGTFATEQRYAAGSSPYSISLGDMDGDSDLDLAIANANNDDTSVLLNNGDGTFAPQQRYAAGDTPLSVTLGDLDGDGDLDMAVANGDSLDTSVLLNNGDGTFAAQQRYAAGNDAISVSLGDLDGDGDSDMAVANYGSDDVSVLLNNGDGTFAAQQRYAAGDAPNGVSLGDLDGDGDLDMAIANAISEDVSILLNNGDGTFAIQLLNAVGDGAVSVSLGDLDGDGDLDMAVPNYRYGTSVLLNNGNGTFIDAPRYAVGFRPENATLGDLDGDGNLDIVVANLVSDDTSVLLNNGDGTFAAQQRYAAGDAPRSVSLGDLDGDGDLDMAVANYFSDDTSVLLNNGDGTFAAQQRYAAGNDAISVSLGDLDGDGDVDMAVANTRSDDASVLLNNGAGTFAAQQRYAAGVDPQGVSLGDLDGDGDLDMAVANCGSDDVSVLLNNDDGTFTAQQTNVAGTCPQSVSLADLDGDGDLDMAVANAGSDDASVLLNNGSGTFAAQQRYAAGDAPRSVSLGDLDGDGDMDMAVVNNDNNGTSVLLNNGDSTFGSQQRYAAGISPVSVSLGDLDSDGDLDMAVANWNGSDVSVLLNRTILPPDEAPILAGDGDGPRITPAPIAAISCPRSESLPGGGGDGPAVRSLSIATIETFDGGSPRQPTRNAGGSTVARMPTETGEVAAVHTSSGQLIPLGTLGGPTSVALAINDAGQVVGWSETADGSIHAFRYTPGDGPDPMAGAVMQDLGTLGGAFSVSMTLNQAGDTAGFSDNPEGLERPFRYSDADGLRDLGAYRTDAGPAHTRALAISPDGRMVAGSATTPDGRALAILWTERTGVIDLNTLLPETSGWRLVSADAFEADGVLVGRALLDGKPTGFRLELDQPDAGAERKPLDPAEIAGFVDAFTSGDPAADLNSDGVIDLLDIQEALHGVGAAR